MRRLFWVALGAVAGVLIVRKITKAAEAYTPAGVARSASDLGEGLRELAAAVREGMAEREEELRIALGVDAGTLDPETARSVRAPFSMADDFAMADDDEPWGSPRR